MARPGRRIPDAISPMSEQASTIAVSEMTGIGTGRLLNWVLVAVARPAPEHGGPGETEVAVMTPGSTVQARKVLEMALDDVRAHGGSGG